MPLSSFEVNRDRFEDRADKVISFPCCCCVHESKNQTDDPCRVCDHNYQS